MNQNKPEHSVKCRVCWEVKEIKVCVIVTTKWAKESLKTIKDVILLCVPWMSIKDDSYLCNPCLWQLKFTYDFIERCLKTENILNEENNMKQVNLEDIFENSLKKGNKIQIIFENPVSLHTNGNDCNEDTDVVVLEDSVQDGGDNMDNIKFKIRTPDATVPSEHDYCIKKGTQIEVNVINSQPNTMAESRVCDSVPEPEQSFSEQLNTSVNEHEKENIFTIDDDNLNDNDTDILNDSTTECTAGKNISDSCNTRILKTILTTRKSRRSKTVLTKPYTPKASEQTELENELKDLLDIAAIDISFITAHSEMSAAQQEDLVRDGVNILNMSTDPNKKKRTLYLSRSLVRSSHECYKCKINFTSRCDYLDHDHLHRKGKIKTPGAPIYTCQFCAETFTLDLDFRTHTKYFHGISSPHQCTKCNRRFKTFKTLKDHNEQFKDQDKCAFKCTRCNREFATRATLSQHEKDVEDAPSCNYKKCRVCCKKFTTEDFKIHCTEVHSNYLCSECGKSFRGSASLSTHKKFVHEGVDSMCHECGKILSHPVYLEHHIQTVHGENKYICDRCPRQFTCKTYLQKHLKVHLDKTNCKTLNATPRWWCDKCGKAYVKKESLRQHENMFHLGISKYSCPICNEGFVRSDYLKRHIRNHERYSTNSCNICRKSFGFEWRLKWHMTAGHDENGKSLEIGTIKRQPPSMKKKYPYKKAPYKFACKICNKVLASKPSLAQHYRAHLNLRKAKCDVCGIIFQGSLALKNHLKLHKDPNFQFSCNICHAYKSSSTELENHMQEVHKNKKYKCSLCSEAFGRKHLLNSHETIVHQEETYKKEALLELLEENQIRLPPDVDNCGVKSKKVAKLGNLQEDVDTVFNNIVNSGSTDTTLAGEFYKNFLGNQTPSRIPQEKRVIIIGNEYRSSEDARACRILEEENRKNDSYVNYKD